MSRLLMALCWLVVLSTPSFAGEEAIGRLVDDAVSFFTPVKGRVLYMEDGAIIANIGSASGLKDGMRLTVLKEGEPFLHPITKEPLGVTEKQVGAAEVVQVNQYSSRLSVLEGEAGAGDILRISSAKVRALFSPSGIGWDLSEDYYLKLKETGRFEVLDASPGSDPAVEAKRLGAEVAIVLEEEDSGQGKMLSQRLLWAGDAKELSHESVPLGEALGTAARLGRELFTLDKATQFISFDIPFQATLIAIGDVDGDGRNELVMSDGRRIMFYAVGASLVPALGDAEIKGRNFIWLDLSDLDGDGRDEVVATEIRGGGIASYVYKYGAGGLSRIWKGDFFVRVLDGRLYGQEASPIGGYKGEVFALDLADGQAKPGKELNLPPGVNIYDFMPIETSGGMAVLAYSRDGYLTLYDPNGVAVWQSADNYGGAIKTFKKASPAMMVETGEWSVNDRILSRGSTILAVRRKPLTSAVKGIGYKNSEIVGLNLSADSVQEVTLFGGITGKALDYAVSGDRLFVLASPVLGIEAGKILKGKNPITTKLYIYTLKGS